MTSTARSGDRRRGVPGSAGVPSLRSYAGAVCVLGCSAAVLWALLAPAATVDLVPVLGFVIAITIAMWVPVRFQHRRGTQGFNVDDAVFVAMLFALPMGLAPVLMVGAGVIAYAAKLRSPTKVAFNVGQLGLWTTAAAATFHAIWDGGDPLHWRSLLALSLATSVAAALNLGAMADLFRRLEGGSWASSFGSVWRVSALAWLGNTAFGLLLALVAIERPLAMVPASLLLVGLYLGYRGYAGVLEDRQRTDHLHAVTRSLVEANRSMEAFRTFGTNLRELLGAEVVEIAVVGRDPRIVRVTEQGLTVLEEPSFELREALRREVPVRLGEPEADRASLAAPLIHSDHTVGAIAVSDRRGLEPWDDTDLTLLATVADEAAVAIKNLELFAQLERERARLEAESTKLGDIVNAASDGIALLDRGGRILTWNAALSDITGVSEEHTVGQPWFVPLRLRDDNGRDILPDDDSPITSALAGRLRREALTFQVLRRDGQWRVLRATFAPVLREDAEPTGTVMVARDVTSEREVEELKADFIATVSHELRTPLTPLKGFLTTLQHRGPQMEPDQLRAVFNAMATQVSRLENLISDLLVVADLDRGTIALRGEPLDISTLVHAAVDEEQVDGRVRHALDPDVRMVGDAPAVIRIVRALVSNALKHTEGPVDVEIVREGGEGLVRVADHGPGIAPWQQRQVFQRFHRLGDHLTRTQGPGLGLPIARALADRMGGSLELTSDVDSGSVFTLRLPVARPRRLDPAAPRPTVAGA